MPPRRASTQSIRIGRIRSENAEDALRKMPCEESATKMERGAVTSNASEGQCRLAALRFSAATHPITRSTITNNMVILRLPRIRRTNVPRGACDKAGVFSQIALRNSMQNLMIYAVARWPSLFSVSRHLRTRRVTGGELRGGDPEFPNFPRSL
jgi:hypothetical protein